MLPDGALFTEDKVPIPVVIVADLRAMADWLPPQAQRIGGISCVGLALDGTSYLTRHSFQQIGERNPTVDDLSHPVWQWDEQAVQSSNQRMEGLAINALLVQLYQPDLLSTGPATKVRSAKGFAAAADPTGTVSPQGPVWIGKDFRLDRTPRAAASNSTSGGGGGAARRPHWPAAIGTPCCMARSARAGGCCGFSRCMWGSAEQPVAAQHHRQHVERFQVVGLALQQLLQQRDGLLLAAVFQQPTHLHQFGAGVAQRCPADFKQPLGVGAGEAALHPLIWLLIQRKDCIHKVLGLDIAAVLRQQ
jgi:hypothetical protein